MHKLTIGLGALLVAAASANADIRITEYEYQALNGTTSMLFEYVELANVGATPVDMTGWSFDDSSRAPGSTSLSSLGIVAPGEAVIITEAADAGFRARWNLGASVKIVAANANNLGRGDEINIYDAGTNLVDRLTFDDTIFAGTVRANGVSVWRYRSDGGGPYGNQDATWLKSIVGDAQNSFTAVSPASDVGSPGVYVAPAPGSIALIGLAGLVAGRRRSA